MVQLEDDKSPKPTQGSQKKTTGLQKEATSVQEALDGAPVGEKKVLPLGLAKFNGFAEPVKAGATPNINMDKVSEVVRLIGEKIEPKMLALGKDGRIAVEKLEALSPEEIKALPEAYAKEYPGEDVVAILKSKLVRGREDRALDALQEIDKVVQDNHKHFAETIKNFPKNKAIDRLINSPKLEIIDEALLVLKENPEYRADILAGFKIATGNSLIETVEKTKVYVAVDSIKGKFRLGTKGVMRKATDSFESKMTELKKIANETEQVESKTIQNSLHSKLETNVAIGRLIDSPMGKRVDNALLILKENPELKTEILNGFEEATGRSLYDTVSSSKVPYVDDRTKAWSSSDDIDEARNIFDYKLNELKGLVS